MPRLPGHLVLGWAGGMKTTDKSGAEREAGAPVPLTLWLGRSLECQLYLFSWQSPQDRLDAGLWEHHVPLCPFSLEMAESSAEGLWSDH